VVVLSTSVTATTFVFAVLTHTASSVGHVSLRERNAEKEEVESKKQQKKERMKRARKDVWISGVARQVAPVIKHKTERSQLNCCNSVQKALNVEPP
jgi:Na+-transporting methylmalonyl-CoA/oxaloacetate decarboxylase gamma subunit